MHISSIDVQNKLAISQSSGTNLLIFYVDERRTDDDRHLEFEAISTFIPKSKKTIEGVLKGLILKYEAERWGIINQRQRHIYSDSRVGL